MNDRNRFVEKNTMLVREFDRYVLEHPEFAETRRPGQFAANHSVAYLILSKVHLTGVAK